MTLVERTPGAGVAGEDEDALLSLLPRAVGGDVVAARAVLGALAPEVTRAARAVLGATDAELDDAVQEALLGVLHALPSFRGECSLRSFANRIAVRAALRARRKSRTRALRREALAAMDAGATCAGPDEQHLSARRHALLRELLDTLPDVQAETLALRVVLGFSLEQTAAATGVPINTVRSRVRLAREALRTRIESQPALLELLRGPL